MRTALIYNFLIEANLMASIAILLMIALRRFLRKPLGNSALCFGWLLVAARLLLPLSLPNPLINAIRSPFALDAAIRPIAGQFRVRLGDALGDFSWQLRSAHQLAAANRVSTLHIDLYNGMLPIRLAQIYLLGVGLVLAWYIFTNVRFRLKLRAGRIEPISGRLLEQYLAVCRERKVKPVPVYFTDPLPSACLVGVFRPYIALPLTASPQDAIHVLTHEICHLKNRDHLWGILRLLCCAVHWFNPLVWIAASMSRTDSELRCDDRVAGLMDDAGRQAYANVLVLAAARRNAPGLGVLATGMTMTGRRLKTRVVAILRDSKPMRWLSVTFAVLASMCLVGAFATSEMTVVPRLLRSHPTLSKTTITEEAEAIAYGKALYALYDDGRISENDQSWYYENAEYRGPDECEVSMRSGDDTMFDAVFDRAGNVKYLWYNRGHGDMWGTERDVSLTESQQADLAEDVRGLIAELNPALAERCNVYTFYAEEWIPTDEVTRNVSLYFWNSQAAMERDADDNVFVEVQISPKVMLNVMSIWNGSMNGNG